MRPFGGQSTDGLAVTDVITGGVVSVTAATANGEKESTDPHTSSGPKGRGRDRRILLRGLIPVQQDDFGRGW